MDFIKYNPTVFVINDEYEISVTTAENGMCFIKIGDKIYHEVNAGILVTEKTLHRIRVPQKELDLAGKYTVIYRKTIRKKAYFSRFEEPLSCDFDFYPVTKTENINAYFLADVHKHFDEAIECAACFEKDTDLYIINGDIGEVETEEDYFSVIDFLGRLSKGEKPVIFSRGNHDARGRLAERFTSFYPSDNGNTYFAFSLGILHGVVLDCGEDKPDINPEYGGVNAFEPFRRAELEFLKKLPENDNGICFSVSHICPVQTTFEKDCIFDIEREIYSEWNDELERIGAKFMLCGHVHRTYILKSGDEIEILPHKYPVIFASKLSEEGFWGAFIKINKQSLDISFNDRRGNITETHFVEI
ncbi:MAG: metallophosphoesterase family protein [Eubacteriales bacterium]